MLFTAAFIALAAPYLVSAAPIKRTASANDMTVLKFAHVLEQFETEFYNSALSKFQDSDFLSAGFSSSQVIIEQFTAIQIDESTHVSVLEDTIISLGGEPIKTCQFNFGSVLDSVDAMIPVARVVENLGVSAYLGAAHLIDDAVLLTAAGSILTVEARHQTILNIVNGFSTAIPSAFDLALSPSEVLAIASQFISGCDLGIPANPTLTITNTEIVTIGTSLTFETTVITSTTDVSGFYCQMLVGGAPFSISLPYNNCVVPPGVNGPVAIFITSDQQPLNNNIRDQATNSVIAGPIMAFIDSESQLLTTMLRSSQSGSQSGSPSTTTQTISPAQASALLSSAGSSPTGSSYNGGSNNGGSNNGGSYGGSMTQSGYNAAATGGAYSPSGNSNSGGSSYGGSSGSPFMGSYGSVPNQPLANSAMGPSTDGSVNVDGWQTPSASTSASAAAPTDTTVAAAPGGASG